MSSSKFTSPAASETSTSSRSSAGVAASRNSLPSPGPADVLRGGPDGDYIRAAKGDDTVDLGDGDDVFARFMVDGYDRVDAGAGQDTAIAYGTAADETMEVSSSGARTRVFGGSPGSLELDATEQVTVDPQFGTDNVIVRDLTATATKQVDAHLHAPDLRVDTLTVIGSTGPETMTATSGGAVHTVSGLAAAVRLISPEQGTKLALDARDGEDTIDARGITKDKLQPILTGGGGKDFVLGTEGQDTVAGGIGDDVAYMGGGLDTFKWIPGDGSDIVEGQAGTDFLEMNGSGGNDRFDVTPVGGRTRVTRDLDAVNMDLGDVERLDIMPGIGGDIVRVADVSGTDTDNVFVNLALARGTTATDQTIDRVFVDGTNGIDAIGATAAGPQVRVEGAPAVVTTAFSDPTLDRLHVDTRLGNDTITVAPNVFQLIGFTWSQ
jgi:Ca2+-binding RTX toxin-like protein